MTITLTGQGGLGDLDGSGTPRFVQSSTGVPSILTSLSVPGLATLPQVYEKAWDVASGSVVGGFPRRQDGFPFYDSPVIADLGGGGARQAIEANDNYWVHAYATDGGKAPGFPKYTGQWIGFSGAVADPRMDGRLHYATITREGDLFDWRVKGSAKLDDSWWHYRHDERNTGLFGLDTRRPSVVRSLRAHRLGHRRVRLSWRAPGDDYAVGRARRYSVRAGGHRVRAHVPKPPAAGKRQTLVVRLPRRVHSLSVRAIDDAGNKGASATARVR